MKVDITKIDGYFSAFSQRSALSAGNLSWERIRFLTERINLWAEAQALLLSQNAVGRDFYKQIHM